jgi:hypothetical protein
MNTATAIRAAALAYNHEYPEGIAAIEKGTPMVDVAAVRTKRGGIRAIVTRIVLDPDGVGSWAAADPEVRYLRDTDGRLDAVEIARRASRYLGVHGAEVSVRYRSLSR